MTIPKLRQRSRVEVTTACSACSETERIAMNVPGNWKPWPTLAGERAMSVPHSGHFGSIALRRIGPRSRQAPPNTTGHFSRRDQVMRKPVDTPEIIADIVGTRRRRPDEVADSRSTA